MKIGILALQGNYQQHKNVLDILGVQNIFVRYANDLKKCDSLIIPGGESSTISKQIDNNKLRKTLTNYAINHPVMGTCAGMIMLSNNKSTDNMTPLKIMDYKVNRNAWGRQTDSFSSNIKLNYDKDKSFHAVFIRAPKISSIGKNIQILSTYNKEPVLLSNGMHLASTFHPEIGNDLRIHQYFINQAIERISAPL